MESVPRCPSPPGGTLGTGGPGRAGTAAAEEQLLGWTGGEGERDVQMESVDDERGEEGVTAGREPEQESRAEAGWEGAGPLFDSGGSGSGESDRSGRQREKGRDVGLGRGEEAGPAGHGGEDG